MKHHYTVIQDLCHHYHLLFVLKTVGKTLEIPNQPSSYESEYSWSYLHQLKTEQVAHHIQYDLLDA